MLKRFVKEKLARHLPALLRRFPVVERANIIGAAIRPHDLFATMSREDQAAHLAVLCHILGVESLAVSGDLGLIEGHRDDTAVFSRYLIERTWSPALLGTVTPLLANGGTYVDVGANIGLTTIPIASSTPARCIAFEPDPESFRFLRKNLITNGIESVEAHNIALFSEETILEFEVAKWNRGDNRIRIGSAPLRTGGSTLTKVPARRLDDVLDHVRGPVVCKVDTQGAEVHVLRGASRFLGRADLVVLEFWPHGLRRTGTDVTELVELLAGFKYGRLTSFDAGDAPSDLRPLSEVARELVSVGDSGEDWYRDLIVAK